MFESFRYGSKLYPLEKALVNEVIKISPGDYKDKLYKQIESVNKIQRHSEFKEVNMYRMKKGRSTFDANIALPYAKLEHVICTIDFLCNDSNTSLKAKAWLVKGYFFSLSFNKSPKQYRMCEDIIIKKILPNFSDLTVHLTCHANDNEKNCLQKLKELLGEHNIVNIRPPVSKVEIEHFLAVFDGRLPPDYIELIAYADGFEIDKWVVHGLKNIRHVIGKDTNYYILAETNNKYLAVKEDDESAKVFSIKHDQDAVDKGESFIVVIRQLLG